MDGFDGQTRNASGQVRGLGKHALADISRIERGIRACSLESLIDLAQELHTSTDYLLTGTGPANDFAKEQLLSAIEVLSSVSKLI